MGKTAIDVWEQIKLLESRGMVIKDKEKAQEVLLDVGYYRLGFYWFPFETTYPNKINRTHQFREGTNFDYIVKLYYFDFKEYPYEVSQPHRDSFQNVSHIQGVESL